MKEWRWIKLALFMLVVGCYSSHVTRDFRYEATSLKADIVSVHVRSDVKASISWIFTDNPVLTISVKVPVTKTNTTKITFSSDLDIVQLVIHEENIQSAHAPATGSGNRLFAASFLLWIPAAVFLRFRRLCFVWTVLALSYSLGYAVPFDSDSLYIEILAPKSFQYSDVRLYAEGGSVKVAKFQPSQIMSADCRTNSSSAGCLHCCYGHGTCYHGDCVCDEGYDSATSCRNKSRRDIFYSHPMDPRLETTVLPSGSSLALSRSYNAPETDIVNFLQYPDVYTLESRDPRSKTRHRISFLSDGFVDRIDYLNEDKVYSLKFKRNRVDQCRLRVMWSESGDENNVHVSICDNKTELNNTVARSLPKGRHSGVYREQDSIRRHNRRTRNDLSSYYMTSKVNLLEVPVLAHRCGYALEEEPQVYAKVTTFNSMLGYSSDQKSIHGESRSLPTGSEHSVVILGQRNSHGKPVILIPDVREPLGIQAIKSKCRETVNKHNDICTRSHLQTYSKICAQIETESTTFVNASAYQYFNLCNEISQILKIYCDHSATKVLSEDRTCRSQYSYSVDLFSFDLFEVIPYATYPDGKTIKGRKLTLSLRVAQEILRNGISIRDKKPDFRITEITVIPKDPVPHDIYQVKLDYDCATNSTVIKMAVTGSDQYSNHVTCHGGQPAGSCTLHAAGAQNAVVDNVTINVTDLQTGLNLTEKMIVIF